MTPPSIFLRQKTTGQTAVGRKICGNVWEAEEEQSGVPTMYLRAHSRNASVYGGGQKSQGKEGVS